MFHLELNALLVTLAFGCSAPAVRPAQEPAPKVDAPAPQAELVRRRREVGAMGTDIVVEAIGTDAAALDAAIVAAIAELRRVEDVMTSWRDSPLTRLNARAGEGPIEVPAELARLVGRALVIAEATDGAFDPTFASVGKLWDFKAEPPKIPGGEEITAALERVGWQRVKVDLEASTVELPAGTRLGLGGIAKGYGVDRAMATLMEYGVKDGVVNAGGDLKALGRDLGETPGAGRRPWQVAVKHPRDRERVLAVIPVSNVCMVTSGDYERFFELDGVRFHHILDPRTGRPATGCTSATVLAPDAAFADAVATAMCVLGPERGLEVAAKLPRVEALLVDLEGEVHTTPGLARLLPR